jgi:tRNA (cytidine/uridine-2'-O-)-methyltransferase
MFNIVLYQPEIPPNTGCYLHLIEPLGFKLEDKQLRRAGLDYHEWADVRIYQTINDLQPEGSVYALSTKGQKHYHQANFLAGDYLVFGPETRGLPADYLDQLDENHILRLPMRAHSRSLNLSNTVAIVCYEALRQNGFAALK